MLPPDKDHFFDWDVLGFRKQEEDEGGHDKDPTSKEEEETELEVAKHCKKSLGNNEGEEEVDRYVDTLPCRTDFQGEDLAGHQPSQGTPRPGEGRHIDANEENHKVGLALGQRAFARKPKFVAKDDPDDDL